MGDHVGDERVDAPRVRRPEHLDDIRRDILHRDQTGPHRVVEIVVDIGDAVGDANHLAFERVRLARRGVGDAGAELGVTKNAVADRKRQVETTPVPFQMIDDAKTLLVVSKAGEGLGQGSLTGVPERGVTEIVAEPDRLDEVLVEEERPADGAGDLGHLEGMGEAGPVVVAGGSDKDLGLVHQPAKALGVEDPVAVALERGSQVALRLWRGPLRPAARRAGGRQQLLLARFQAFPNRGHGVRHDISLELRCGVHDGHPPLFDDVHGGETCQQALRPVAHELDGDLLVAAALLGFDDLTLAELGMEDRLPGFVRDREHLGQRLRSEPVPRTLSRRLPADPGRSAPRRPRLRRRWSGIDCRNREGTE